MLLKTRDLTQAEWMPAGEVRLLLRPPSSILNAAAQRAAFEQAAKFGLQLAAMQAWRDAPQADDETEGSGETSPSFSLLEEYGFNPADWEKLEDGLILAGLPDHIQSVELALTYLADWEGPEITSDGGTPEKAPLNRLWVSLALQDTLVLRTIRNHAFGDVHERSAEKNG